MMNPVQRRLAPLVISFFFGGVSLWAPVEKLFLRQIGFSAQTVGLLAAVYAATVPILEIPTGMLADRWSRRGVLVLGNVSLIASVLVGGLATNVGTYLVAAALLGVFFAMQSGTFDAIVYEVVVEETGSSDRFEATIGRLRMAESVSLVIGALAGGALATATSPRITYFATLPFLAVSTLSLFRFREPRLHEHEATSFRRHFSMTLGAIRQSRSVLPVMAVLVLAGILVQTVIEFGSLWIINAHGHGADLGPQWAALMASMGVGGFIAARGRLQTIGSKTLVALSLLGAGVALTSTSSTFAEIAAETVLVGLGIALTVVFTARLHDAIASEVRAGVASFVGLLTWAAFVPFALVFGHIASQLGIHAAGWLLLGTAAALVVVYALAGSTRPSSEVAAATATLESAPPLQFT